MPIGGAAGSKTEQPEPPPSRQKPHSTRGTTAQTGDVNGASPVLPLTLIQQKVPAGDRYGRRCFMWPRGSSFRDPSNVLFLFFATRVIDRRSRKPLASASGHRFLLPEALPGQKRRQTDPKPGSRDGDGETRGVRARPRDQPQNLHPRSPSPDGPDGGVT